MKTALIFVGKKYYPLGGARDLKGTLTAAEFTDDGVGELFRNVALNEDWLDDDYWVNGLEVAADGSVTAHHWLAYIRKDTDQDPFKEADYATFRGSYPGFQVLLVPLAERNVNGTVWMGPRDYPDVVFY